MSEIIANPSGIGFTWDPEITNLRTDLRSELFEFKKIMTHHDDLDMGMFRPDVVEVLNQIPKADFKRCVAFMTDAESAKRGGYSAHIAETTLFCVKN